MISLFVVNNCYYERLLITPILYICRGECHDGDDMAALLIPPMTMVTVGWNVIIEEIYIIEMRTCLNEEKPTIFLEDYEHWIRDGT